MARSIRLCFVFSCLFTCLTAAAQDSLRERLKDENGTRIDVWVYNDIETARAQARKGQAAVRYVPLHYEVGDELPLTVLRGRRQVEVQIKLVE